MRALRHFFPLLALLASCGPARSAQPLAAARPTAAPSSAAPAAARPTAAPSTSSAPAASTPAATSGPSPHNAEPLAVADKLTGGDFGRAEAYCAGAPKQEHELCVNGYMAVRVQEREAVVARNLRALTLLDQVAEKSCTSADAASHDDCVAAAKEQKLRELPCSSPSSDAEFACQVRIILERYGP